MKVYLFNTSIITGGAGNYSLIHSSINEFRKIWYAANEKVSAIGHEATAQVFSTILGEKIEVNRVQAIQQPDEIALVLKMRGRIPEGTILTDIEEIEKIGYDLYKLTCNMIYREHD